MVDNEFENWPSWPRLCVVEEVDLQYPLFHGGNSMMIIYTASTSKGGFVQCHEINFIIV
jgi:hypothetical protein